MSKLVSVSAGGEDERLELSVLVKGIWVHHGTDAFGSALFSLKHHLSLLAMALLENNYLH